jgi:hypothetical protein
MSLISFMMPRRAATAPGVGPHQYDHARSATRCDCSSAPLLAPHLPQVPGLEPGAGYRAAGAGDEVGGDFYDVFQQGDGSWLVVGHLELRCAVRWGTERGERHRVWLELERKDAA